MINTSLILNKMDSSKKTKFGEIIFNILDKYQISVIDMMQLFASYNFTPDEYDQYILILYQDGLLVLHGIHYIVLIDSIECLRQDILDILHINARYSYPQIKQQIEYKFQK